MLTSISPQLESIDAIAERYKFSEKERIQLYEKSIEVLSKGRKTIGIARILFKVLLQFVKRKEATVENVILLYVLSVQLLNVSQYNQLIEMPAYKTLKDVFFISLWLNSLHQKFTSLWRLFPARGKKNTKTGS